MTLTEKYMDLFTVGPGYVLAHCISADFVMGAGIAKQFTDKGVKDTLLNKYTPNQWDGKGYIRVCSMTNNNTPYTVANLITKQYVHDKPTYEMIEQSLVELKNYLVSRTIMRLAIPRIGCGLDGLDWNKVESIIKKVFKNTMIDILVCDWP